MATGYVTPTSIDALIPETWRKDIVLELYDRMVMRDLVNVITVPPGTDTVHFPAISKLTAEQITPGTPLEGKYNTESAITLSIDKYYGVPMTISEKALIQVQQNISLGDIYKQRMAEALAYKMDQDLLGLYSGLSQSVDLSSGDITKAGILEARRLLNKAGAPQSNRYLVISPEQEEAMLSISDFVDASKYGDNAPIRDGFIGKVFGFEVFVTDAVITASTRKNLAFHRDFALLGIQQEVKITSAWMPMKDGYDMVAKVLYGVTEMRDDFGVVIVTKD